MFLMLLTHVGLSMKPQRISGQSPFFFFTLAYVLTAVGAFLKGCENSYPKNHENTAWKYW